MGNNLEKVIFKLTLSLDEELWPWVPGDHPVRVKVIKHFFSLSLSFPGNGRDLFEKWKQLPGHKNYLSHRDIWWSNAYSYYKSFCYFKFYLELYTQASFLHFLLYLSF
jgi:hypothetical protein